MENELEKEQPTEFKSFVIEQGVIEHSFHFTHIFIRAQFRSPPERV